MNPSIEQAAGEAGSDALGALLRVALNDDGTLQGPAVQSALGGYIPVLDVKGVYGAKGDGTTDDASRVQAALDDAYAAGGGIVYFPIGDYLVGSTLTTPTSAQAGVTMRGAGVGGTGVYPTRIKRSGNFSLLTADGSGVGAGQQHNGLALRDLTLHGQSHTSPLVDLYCAASVDFDRVRLTGSADYALRGQQLWNCAFTRCFFESSGDAGGTKASVLLTDSQNLANANTNTVQFLGCIWEANLWTDLELAGAYNPCAGVVVTNGKWERTVGYAVRIANAQQCSIIGGYMFQNSGNPAIRHEGGSLNTFMGITALSDQPASPGALFQFLTGSNAVVVGNTLKGGSSSQIRINDNFGDILCINKHSLMGSEAFVNDTRTSKTGTIIANGRAVLGAVVPRAQLSLTGQGLIAETFDRKLSASTIQPASGDLRGALVGLKEGDVVTSISITITTGGTSVSHAQAALYAKDGTLLASSGDSAGDRTACQSTGIVTFNLSSPYTITADDVYYIAVTISSTGTMPTVLRGSSQAGSINAVGSGKLPTVVQTGQATVPSSATFSTSASTLWLAAA